ncbi:MAG: GldG family protein [Puniceicoccales bacterium]|jgi:hypothetical protein|nr:GldG family protein [Puniceicoccales bacterium]
MANFRSSNKIRTLCFLLCISLIVVLHVTANIVSSKYFFRKVFGEKSKYVLSDESQKILANLKSDVEIFVLLEKTQDCQQNTFELIKKNLRHLMNEYANFTGEHRISMEVVNVAESSKKYADLCERFGILPINCVVVAVNGKVKVLTVDELYKTQNGRIVLFAGEEIISLALQELTSESGSVIYFITGHGENELDGVSFSRGLSTVKNLFKHQNWRVQQINLCESKAIPPDANLVVISGARSRILGFEVEILRDFVDSRDGKLVIALDGNFDVGLREFLEDYGIFLAGNLLLPGDDAVANYSEDLIVRRFAPHKINEKLIEFQIPVVFGGTREVSQASWFLDEEKFEITELLQTDGVAVENETNGDESISIAHVVATLSERKKFITSEVTTNAGKVLVIGNADFMANEKIKILGNRIFLLGISSYMLRRNDSGDFDGIKIEDYRLALSRKDIWRIGGRILMLPASFLLLTMVIAFLRRK